LNADNVSNLFGIYEERAYDLKMSGIHTTIISLLNIILIWFRLLLVICA